jgi:predicted nucleic-acid-binding Zn-ribbon protein
MRTTSRCPKCRCGQLFVVEQMAQPHDGSVNRIIPLSVTCLDTSAAELGLEKNRYRAAVGRFEAWICANCGFTEWYAKDVRDVLWRYLQQGRTENAEVRFVDADAGKPGPYR